MQALLGAFLAYRAATLWSASDSIWGPLGLAQRTGALWRFVSACPFSISLILSAQLVCAALLALGYGTRAASMIAALLFWFLQSRLPEACDAGDYAARHLLCISVLFVPPRRESPTSVEILMHNCGIVLVLTQASVIYLSAGISKLQTNEWRTGSALALVASNPRFQSPALALLPVQPTVARVLCNLLVAHQVCWPALLLTRFRRTSLMASAVFHVATALLMGLVSFSIAMLAMDAFLLSPAAKRPAREQP